MNIVYAISGTPIPNRVNFLKEGGSFNAVAFKCEYGSGGVRIEDPDGNLEIAGWETFTVDDLDASPTRVWTGYIFDKSLQRGELPPAGVNRVHDCDIIDGNAALQFQVLHSNDAKRPAETDVERVQWLLTSEAITGNGNQYVEDLGLVSTLNPVSFLDKDCRQSFANAVLRTLCEIAQKNAFGYIDEYTGRAGLFYDKDESAVYVSPIRISNVIADVDGITTFYPDSEATLRQSGNERFGGVLFNWQGDPIYAQSASTIASMNNIVRDAVISDEKQIGDAATAALEALSFLNTHANESQTISVTILMPSETVNLLYAGMRMEVKFTHFTGFEDFTWTRVRSKGVRTKAVDVEGTWTTLWEVDLELWVPPVPIDDGEVIGGPECVPEASFAQLQSVNRNATGPLEYNLVWLNSGDNPDSNHAPAPLTGLLEYYLPSGSGGTGIRALGDGDLTVTLLCDVALVASGDYNAEFQVLKNGDPVLQEMHSTTGGLRFESWTTAPLTGIVSVVEGDILTVRYIDNAGYSIDTFPAGVDATDFTAEGDLCEIDPAEVPLPYLGDPVGPETPTPPPDGSTTDFTGSSGWLPGTLVVLHDGIDETANIATQDPAAGTFTLNYAPSVGSIIDIRYESR